MHSSSYFLKKLQTHNTFNMKENDEKKLLVLTSITVENVSIHDFSLVLGFNKGIILQ